MSVCLRSDLSLDLSARCGRHPTATDSALHAQNLNTAPVLLQQPPQASLHRLPRHVADQRLQQLPLGRDEAEVRHAVDAEEGDELLVLRVGAVDEHEVDAPRVLLLQPVHHRRHLAALGTPRRVKLDQRAAARGEGLRRGRAPRGRARRDAAEVRPRGRAGTSPRERLPRGGREAAERWPRGSRGRQRAPAAAAATPPRACEAA
mmetsp:Transcript_14213/g.45668  ORF Transcript_14213/g.45668 Transcript_14213/m.45668 type:complete len:204 (+) Transcript_14213:18-629(+)